VAPRLDLGTMVKAMTLAVLFSAMIGARAGIAAISCIYSEMEAVKKACPATACSPACKVMFDKAVESMNTCCLKDSIMQRITCRRNVKSTYTPQLEGETGCQGSVDLMLNASSVDEPGKATLASQGSQTDWLRTIMATSIMAGSIGGIVGAVIVLLFVSRRGKVGMPVNILG